MSVENVEVVRRTMAALERAFDAYWRDPRPIVRAYEDGELWPEWEEWFSHGGDRVYAEVSITGQSKESRPRMATRFYDVITIRDGKIARLEEYTTRQKALEAARVA